MDEEIVLNPPNHVSQSTLPVGEEMSSEFDLQTDIEVLDPNGDLLIQNGPLCLRVSSNVLLLSTTYFQKMLQWNFAESLPRPSRASPPVKTLADDHPQIFRMMCKILHFQEVDKPENAEQLGLLADVCDYYGREKAVSSHVHAWIEEWIEAEVSIEEMMRLLWVAYIFNLQKAFARISSGLAAVLTAPGLAELDLHPMPVAVKG